MHPESDDLLRLAAKLYYVDDLAENKVAQIIGVSRSTVSRLLTRAREKGIVRITVEEYDPRNTALEKNLAKRFHLNHVIVIKTIGARSVVEVRRAMGYFAAPLVAQFVRPQSVVGLAGGRSLAELIEAIAPSREHKNLTVVQLMGNIGPSVSNIDAIELSRTLAQRLGGTFYTINAPAFAATPSARQVFTGHEHVRSVWQLFDQMQIAFVGVGTLSGSAFIERGVLEATDLAKLQAQGVVGEICGRFYDKRGRECKTDFCSRVISISLDQLRQVKEVVGVTHGKERASAIHAALDSGLLKSLIIDEEGAEAILQIESAL